MTTSVEFVFRLSVYGRWTGRFADVQTPFVRMYRLYRSLESSGTSAAETVQENEIALSDMFVKISAASPCGDCQALLSIEGTLNAGEFAIVYGGTAPEWFGFCRKNPSTTDSVPYHFEIPSNR